MEDNGFNYSHLCSVIFFLLLLFTYHFVFFLNLLAKRSGGEH